MVPTYGDFIIPLAPRLEISFTNQNPHFAPGFHLQIVTRRRSIESILKSFISKWVCASPAGLRWAEFKTQNT